MLTFVFSDEPTSPRMLIMQLVQDDYQIQIEAMASSPQFS